MIISEIILKENLVRFMLDTGMFYEHVIIDGNITEKTINNVDGYLFNVKHPRTSMNVFVIKYKYYAWLRDKKIDSILE